ncbi:hypothetical protein AY600_08630 [Phormidium willei BDU 130791]|nr:hypothetical protein AY600_08630 [Phormidium willei BDU 130791]
MNRRVVFEFSAFEDFNNWAVANKKIYQKIVKLIYDIDRSPSQGLGKPEALKHDLEPPHPRVMAGAMTRG